MPLWLCWLILSALYSLIFTTIEFSGFPVSGIRGLATLAAQWGVVAVASSGLVGLSVISRRIMCVAFPVLVTVSTVLAYFRLSMNVSLTPDIIELGMVNDAATSADLVSMRLVVWMVTAFAVSAVCVWLRWKYVSRVHGPGWYACGVLSVAMACLPEVDRFSNPVYSRAPFSVIYSINEYCRLNKVVAETRDTFDSVDAVAASDSIDVVLVIGESLRADHLPMNGYDRNTMPYLSREGNLVVLSRVYSIPVFTHESVPYLVTRADRDNPAAGYSEQSFLTLAAQAGFKTAWLSNQDEVDTYTYFMHEADTLVKNQPGVNLYNFSQKKLDGDLLGPLAEVLSDPATDKKIAVMHTIGSHWWYNLHFPDSMAVFTPLAQSKVISENGRQRMVNSYDNTIVYTDWFMKQVIDMLRDRKAVVIYQSDHGESLGENGKYLHGEETEELHWPAAFIWYSDKYKATYGDKIAGLESRRDSLHFTDYVFHTVLDAADVTTEVMDCNRSLLRPLSD